MSKMNNVFLLLDEGFTDDEICGMLDISYEYLDYCITIYNEELENV